MYFLESSIKRILGCLETGQFLFQGENLSILLLDDGQHVHALEFGIEHIRGKCPGELFLGGVYQLMNHRGLPGSRLEFQVLSEVIDSQDRILGVLKVELPQIQMRLWCDGRGIHHFQESGQSLIMTALPEIILAVGALVLLTAIDVRITLGFVLWLIAYFSLINWFLPRIRKPS